MSTPPSSLILQTECRWNHKQRTIILPKNVWPEMSFSHLHFILVNSPTLTIFEDNLPDVDLLLPARRLAANRSEQPVKWSIIRQVRMIIRPVKKTTRLEDKK